MPPDRIYPPYKKSVAVTGDLPGTGGTGALAEICEALGGIPIVPSGGVLRRSLAAEWARRRQNPENHTKSSKTLWREFEHAIEDEYQANNTLSIPITPYDEQDEAVLSEFDQVYGLYANKFFWEYMVEEISGGGQLLREVSGAEGKLLILWGKIFPEEAELFYNKVVCFLLTLKDREGNPAIDESARRVLQREMANGNVATPEKTDHEHYNQLLAATKESIQDRLKRHWSRFEEVYGLTPADLDQASKEPHVHTINTYELSVNQTHLAMLLIYLHEVPQSAAQLVPHIYNLIDTIKAETNDVDEVTVIKKLIPHAPHVVQALDTFD